MDRTIIEEITDPLVHLLRNAVDHGLESTAEREAAGKPPAGRIDLSARYEGNEVWIVVSDDGRGIDRAAVRRKAHENGLLANVDQPLCDEEIFRMILEPGFSTSQNVTDISGRGVGLDVVKKNIDRLRGAISISTTEGKGTRIILKIPLTLAVVSATMIRVGAQVYAVPIYATREFIKPLGENLFTAEGRSLVRVREEVIPVVRLRDFFKARGGAGEAADGILIIIESGGRKAGLLADSIEGYQQIVIKSLTDYIGRPRGVSGCSILGSDEVCFILDAGGILEAELE